MHDALIVRVHASSVCFGLVGVPMRAITLEAGS
jgi:lipopolysaccharide transport system ATP-binding protein